MTARTYRNPITGVPIAPATASAPVSALPGLLLAARVVALLLLAGWGVLVVTP